MNKYIYQFKISVFLLFTFYFLFSAFFVLAQTAPQTASQPQFFVSWKAYSYAPLWYNGKIFPTKGTRVEVVFELLENGKIVDLSQIKVRWYINDKLVKNEKNGLGIKSLAFNVDNYSGQEVEARIAIVGYKENSQLDKIVKIPVIAPEIVIDAPYPNREISIGSSNFSAYPFFFNIKSLKDLSFSWLAEGRPAESAGEFPESFVLNIDSTVPVKTVLNVQTIVKNLLNEFESANKNINLTVK